MRGRSHRIRAAGSISPQTQQKQYHNTHQLQCLPPDHFNSPASAMFDLDRLRIVCPHGSSSGRPADSATSVDSTHMTRSSDIVASIQRRSRSILKQLSRFLFIGPFLCCTPVTTLQQRSPHKAFRRHSLFRRLETSTVERLRAVVPALLRRGESSPSCAFEKVEERCTTSYEAIRVSIAVE